MAMLIGLFTFDIIDLGALAYVAPALREEWGISLGTVGLLTSAAFIGMFIGGLVGGRLADRFGRRRVLLLAVVFFSLASLSSAAATGPVYLGITRFLTGLGLQAATGAILVLVSEMFPKPFRGRAMSVVLGVSLLGAPLIGLVARVVVPGGGWPWIFVVGAMGLISAAVAYKALPESPRWLAAQGRWAEADAGVRAFEEEVQLATGRALPPLFVDRTVPQTHGSGLAELFRRGLIRRTGAATLAFCLLVLLNFGVAQWLPTILIERGYPQDDALTFTFILSFAYIVGALAAAVVIDRFERKVTIAVSALIMAAAYLSIGFVDLVPVLLVAGFIAGALSQTVAAILYSYVPEMFPTEVRGAGAGFANGVGRIAGAFSGVIVAAIITAFATEGFFIYLAGVAALMALAIQLGPRVGIREARDVLKEERALLAKESSGTLTSPVAVQAATTSPPPAISS
jgi:putative MFS transporter